MHAGKRSASRADDEREVDARPSEMRGRERGWGEWCEIARLADLSVGVRAGAV